MTSPASTATRGERRIPPLGGFNLTFLGMELRRMLRNRRTIVFALVLPPVIYLAVGTNSGYKNDHSLAHGNVAGYVMISMAVYGAILSTTSGGAMVSVERSLGWSRQLRLTPLKPVAYIVIKMLIAMLLGAASIVVVFIVGGFTGADVDGRVWVFSALIAWLASVVFAAFGVFMGYLLPSENVMQILGPALAFLAFAGGLFIPINGGVMLIVSKFMPTYGIAELAREPLTGTGFTPSAIANVVVWAAVFIVGAALLFRRDTKRV